MDCSMDPDRVSCEGVDIKKETYYSDVEHSDSGEMDEDEAFASDKPVKMEHGNLHNSGMAFMDPPNPPCIDCVEDPPSSISQPYVCGSCWGTFDTACKLHAHVEAHGLGGSYYYDHRLKVAYPKYDNVCSETQTDVSSFEERHSSNPLGILENLRDNRIAIGTQVYEKLIVLRKVIDKKDSQPPEGSSNVDHEANLDAILEELKMELEKTLSMEQENLMGKTMKRGARKRSTRKTARNVNYNTDNGTNEEEYLPEEDDLTQDQNSEMDADGEEKTSPGENDDPDKDKDGNGTSRKTARKRGRFCKLSKLKATNRLKAAQKKREKKNRIPRQPKPKGPQSLTCPICDRTCTNKGNFNLHFALHKETKDFQCELCGKAFKLKSYLKSHVSRCPVLDNRVKDVECEVCNQKFYDKKNMKKHLRDVHTEIRAFTCEICGAQFKSKPTLKHHLVCHRPDRPTMKCDLCDATFKEVLCLKRHKRRHLEQARLECEFCGKQFYENWNLKAHRRTHTGDKPYKCDWCDLAFAHNVSRKAHMEKCHPGSHFQGGTSPTGPGGRSGEIGSGHGSTHNVGRKPRIQKFNTESGDGVRSGEIGDKVQKEKFQALSSDGERSGEIEGGLSFAHNVGRKSHIEKFNTAGGSGVRSGEIGGKAQMERFQALSGDGVESGEIESGLSFAHNVGRKTNIEKFNIGSGSGVRSGEIESGLSFAHNVGRKTNIEKFNIGSGSGVRSGEIGGKAQMERFQALSGDGVESGEIVGLKCDWCGLRFPHNISRKAHMEKCPARSDGGVRSGELGGKGQMEKGHAGVGGGVRSGEIGDGGFKGMPGAMGDGRAAGGGAGMPASWLSGFVAGISGLPGFDGSYGHAHNMERYESNF